MKHVKIIVKGKVQRIGFRFTTMQMAVKFGINGIVKNLEQNQVYIEAEGEEIPLNNFIEWCRNGPPWAQINQVTIEQGEPKHYVSFEIVDK
jgi:acylphosphatase